MSILKSAYCFSIFVLFFSCFGSDTAPEVSTIEEGLTEKTKQTFLLNKILPITSFLLSAWLLAKGVDSISEKSPLLGAASSAAFPFVVGYTFGKTFNLVAPIYGNVYREALQRVEKLEEDLKVNFFIKEINEQLRYKAAKLVFDNVKNKKDSYKSAEELRSSLLNKDVVLMVRSNILPSVLNTAVEMKFSKPKYSNLYNKLVVDKNFANLYRTVMVPYNRSYQWLSGQKDCLLRFYNCRIPLNKDSIVSWLVDKQGYENIIQQSVRGWFSSTIGSFFNKPYQDEMAFLYIKVQLLEKFRVFLIGNEQWLKQPD